ncbi:MAG TPA: TolC family protein [Minicystis sp.]|nr:TolC family protein [Minicystis sp.]
MRRLPTLLLAALSLVTATAGAQPAKPAKPATAPPRPVAPLPVPAAPAPGAPLGPTALPNVEVSDPLLAPVPAPPHVLANWQQIIQLINSRSTDLVIARAEIERSRGLWRQALALALPTITATGSASADLIPSQSFFAGFGSQTQQTAALSGAVTASVPVFALGTWYGIGTADRAVKATRMTAEDRARTVLAAVANSIVAVVTAERVAEVNRVGLKSALQTLELTVRKQRLGSGTQLDVVRASQDVSNARATLITGDESLRKARESLGLALGFNDAWGVTQQVSLDQIGDSLRRICQPAHPEDRADVLAARANLDVANRGVTSSYLAYAPTITVSSTANASKISPLDSTSNAGSSYSWTIEGLLTIPIWDGGARYGTTRIAKAQQTEAKANLDLALRSSQLETTQAVREVDVAEASKAVAQSTRDLAKETARLAQIAFEAGTGTSFDLVTSQAQARQAELNLAVSEFQVIQARLTAMLAAADCKY